MRASGNATNRERRTAREKMATGPEAGPLMLDSVRTPTGPHATPRLLSRTHLPQLMSPFALPPSCATERQDAPPRSFAISRCVPDDRSLLRPGLVCRARRCSPSPVAASKPGAMRGLFYSGSPPGSRLQDLREVTLQFMTARVDELEHPCNLEDHNMADNKPVHRIRINSVEAAIWAYNMAHTWSGARRYVH